tara:strand:- start:572 stop:973 length:402 start_codon:yes stop_codon:yes gene_type:complete
VGEFRKKWNKDYTSKFDIDLKFGEEFEYSLAKILSVGKVEVKTERNKWKKTGNIAIELMSRGKLSGLTVTEAEWWAHILTYRGKIESVILIPVNKLKKLVKRLVDEGKARIVMGGDDDTSELVLVSLRDIHGV